MKVHKIILIGALLFDLALACAQEKKPDLKLVFYNTENFFDSENDPNVNDEEFLPEGSRHWTFYRFNEKAKNIYKVLAAIGEFSFPDIVAMCEVENSFVLDYLLKQTPMKVIPMAYVHKESSDPRGIDVCILYRTDKLKLLRSEFIKARKGNSEEQRTRDIVYAVFQTKQNDILHVFANHWPSRRGGELETQQKRNMMAAALRGKIDFLLKTDPSAKIVITGDFNDNPFNQSITKNLKTQKPGAAVITGNLYNLSSQFIKTYGTGTIKYRGNWAVYDQIIVSGSLLNHHALNTCESCAGVFNKSFLLTEDKTNMGYAPFRTFTGLKYTGGFSDHLPVYLNLYFKAR
jgi:predicted extracellular nuclease